MTFKYFKIQFTDNLNLYHKKFWIYVFIEEQ